MIITYCDKCVVKKSVLRILCTKCVEKEKQKDKEQGQDCGVLMIDSKMCRKRETETETGRERGKDYNERMIDSRECRGNKHQMKGK